MTIPLILLAIPSVLLGLLIGFPPENGLLHGWLAPVFEEALATGGQHEAAFSLIGIDGVLILASVTVAVLGIVVAWRLFGVELPLLRREPEPERVQAITARAPFLYRASLNKWWFDDLYDLLFIRIGGRIAAALWWFDRVIVDGTVNGIGIGTQRIGGQLRQVQTGRVQNYALGIALGLLVMAGSYLVITAR